MIIFKGFKFMIGESLFRGRRQLDKKAGGKGKRSEARKGQNY